MKQKQALILTVCIVLVMVLTSIGNGNSLPMLMESHVLAESIEWSDDFSDGNYDGWTVMEGSFHVPSSPRYVLTAASSLSMISHPSTQANGTWFFEMYENTATEYGIEILFMATGSTVEDFEGYSIQLAYYPSEYHITFLRWNYTAHIGHSAKWTLGMFPIWTDALPEPDPDWHQYNITRTDNGTIYVLRDDEPLFTSTPATLEWEFNDVFTTSDKFIVRAHSGAKIDTVVVGTDLLPVTTPITSTTSTTTTTTTTTTDTTTTDTTTSTETSSTTTDTGTSTPTNPLGGFLSLVPIIAFGGVGVFVIAVIVVFQKRR